MKSIKSEDKLEETGNNSLIRETLKSDNARIKFGQIPVLEALDKEIISEGSNPKGKKGVCCFCGARYYNWGNNPAPLMQDTDEKPNRCCDNCNVIRVIPERLKLMRLQNK
jgi:hypothetical protein